MRTSLSRLAVAWLIGILLMVGVLTATAGNSLNIPYKPVAWTGNVYLPPTVHYSATETHKKTIPPITVHKDDYNVVLNHVKLVKPGKPGYVKDSFLVYYTNSHVDVRKHVVHVVVKPTPAIVAIGKYVHPSLPPPPPAAPTTPLVQAAAPSNTDQPAPPAVLQPVPVPVYSGGDPRSIAESMVSAGQWSCLDQLWEHESGWNVSAYNPSGAYGIPQALPGSKMASAGADWQTNPRTQIVWGLGYIAGVYGSPCGAWDHELAFNWY